MEILSNSTFILVQKMAVLLLYKQKAAPTKGSSNFPSKTERTNKVRFPSNRCRLYSQ
jgi:hypothetical protein